MKQHLLTGIVAASLLAASGAYAQTKQEPVSYTHLTLPTKA